MSAGKDHRAYEFSLATLREEIEHEAWSSAFLGEGPSGDFRRQGTGFQQNSPASPSS
jgi:ferritin-like protein